MRQNCLKGRHLSAQASALETLKILREMRQTNKPYDEAMHTRNQVPYGSWVIDLTHPAPVGDA